MKRRIAASVLAVVFALSSVACTRARVAVGVSSASQGGLADIGLFYDDLAPYGNWYSIESYGWVWSPYGLGSAWRPYSNGYWVYTDYGWTWVSNYRWGWGPFHYGRWVFTSQYGWVWIPGTLWAPAWVVWRRGPGWIGWAPLPPEIRWRESGLHHGDYDYDRYIHDDWYCFVNDRHFGSHDVHEYIEPRSRNAEYFKNTKNFTDITVVNNRIVNRGIPIDDFERDTHQRIQRRRLVDAGPRDAGKGNKLSGNDVVVYRPKIEDRTPARTPPATRGPVTKQEREAEKQQAEQQRIEQKQQRKIEQQRAEQERLKAKQEQKAQQQQSAQQKKLEKQQRKAQQKQEKQQRKQEKQEKKQQQKQKPPSGSDSSPGRVEWINF